MARDELATACNDRTKPPVRMAHILQRPARTLRDVTRKKTMKSAGWATGFLLGTLLVFSTARGQAEDPEAYRSDYQTGDYGRVRYEENDPTVVRAPSEDRGQEEEAAEINSPVYPGDTVSTDRSQRLEIQLAGGTLVRVDRDSELTFLSLPDPYAEFPDNVVLKLEEGTIQLGARFREKGEFRVDTPASSVYLLGDGEFRIAVDSRGQTQVLSRRGVAEVVGEGGSVLVRGGMRTAVYPGSVPDDPHSFNTFASDGFDHWVAERQTPYRGGDRHADADASDPYDEIPYEVRPYYRELAAHGRWVYLPTYGYSWYPYDVGPGWRPYAAGYWNYGPRGYFWVSHEPWGWAPYHYGRWNWAPGYGWCWVPGRVFAGAWVSWSWGPQYVGWSPLDYWNRPAVIGRVHHGHYDPHCWTFVRYNHLAVRDYRPHAVPLERIGTAVRAGVVVTRPPRVSPRRLANESSWREHAVARAREERVAHVPAASRDRVPGRGFSDVETHLLRKIPKAADRRAVRVPVEGTTVTSPLNPGRESRAAGRPVGPRGPGAAAAREGPREGAASSGPGVSRYPRRISARSSPAERSGREIQDKQPLPRARASTRAPVAEESPAASPDRAPQRQTGRRGEELRRLSPPAGEASEPRDSGDRLRGMYRRMARPRETQKREEASQQNTRARPPISASPAPPVERVRPTIPREPVRRPEIRAPAHPPRPAPRPAPPAAGRGARAKDQQPRKAEKKK